jgi:hypothetical protein
MKTTTALAILALTTTGFQASNSTDYSAIACKDKSKYLPNLEVDGGTYTCDTWAQKAFHGKPTPWSCNTSKSLIDMWATHYGCCGPDKQSSCYVDVGAAVCKDGSSYLGSHTFSGGKFTCDSWWTYATNGKGPTCTDENSPGFSHMTMKQVTNTMVSSGCCGAKGKSFCEDKDVVDNNPIDYSAIACLDKSKYLPNLEVDGGTYTCDTWAQKAFHGKPTPWNCSNSKSLIDMWATRYLCCGPDKQSACYVDVGAAVCKDKSSYLGSHKFSDGKFTCDSWWTHATSGKGPTCSDEKSPGFSHMTMKEVTNTMVTEGCCGAKGKSFCDGLENSSEHKFQASLLATTLLAVTAMLMC